uniref:Putative secreted protein n=1 Tax=Anopheles darlingi TaxID=43151 RepID=A0A2M4DPR4_ANODA
MCIWIANGTIWCRLRTCSAVTLPSVHTRSINLQTIFATALPVSPGSCSSKPSSLFRSLLWLRDSITLFETLVSSSAVRPSARGPVRPIAPPTSCGMSRYTIRLA